MKHQSTDKAMIVIPLCGIILLILIYLKLKTRRRIQATASSRLYAWAGDVAASYVGQQTVEMMTDTGKAFAQNYHSEMTSGELLYNGVAAVKTGSLSQLDKAGNQMIQERAHPVLHPHVSITVYSVILSISLMTTKSLFMKGVKMTTTNNVITIFAIQVLIGFIVATGIKALCSRRN